MIGWLGQGTIAARCAAVLALALTGACGGGGGGGDADGAGDGALTPNDYRALYESYAEPGGANAMAPTSDLPVSGRATYEGAVRVDLARAGGGDPFAEMLGDVHLGVIFGDPDGPGTRRDTVAGGSITTRTGTTPVTGTVDNIRGTLADGTDFATDVEFSTAHAAARAVGGGVLRTEVGTVDTGIAGLPTVTTTAGAIDVPMGARIDERNTPALGLEGTALLTLDGNMVGPRGAAAFGPARLVVDEDGIPGAVDISGTGTFVVEKR